MPTLFGPENSGNGSFDEFIARYLQGQRFARSARPIDLTRLLSRRTHEVLANAARFAVAHGHTDVDALHLLRVMVDQAPIDEPVRNAGADPAAIIAAADQRLPGNSSPSEDPAPALTPSAQRALLDAHQVARAFGSTYIDPEHLFFALVLNQDSPAGHVLAAAGVTPESLQAGAVKAANGASADQAAQPASADSDCVLSTRTRPFDR